MIWNSLDLLLLRRRWRDIGADGMHQLSLFFDACISDITNDQTATVLLHVLCFLMLKREKRFHRSKQIRKLFGVVVGVGVQKRRQNPVFPRLNAKAKFIT